MNIKVKYDPLSSAIDNSIQGKAINGSIADFCKEFGHALYGGCMPFYYFIYNYKNYKKVYIDNKLIEIKEDYSNNVTSSINPTNKNIIDITYLFYY